MKNKIQDLRNHLFTVLEGLCDDNTTVNEERVSGVVKISDAIIKTAKLEIEYYRKTGNIVDDSFWCSN